MQLDAGAALRDFVLSQTGVLDLLGESDDVTDKRGVVWTAARRVLVNQIPADLVEASSTLHPPKMLVLQMAGGPGRADLLPIEDLRVAAVCYGETMSEADRVRRAVYPAFVSASREIHAGVLIHHINPAGGPVPLVDPDIKWPAVAQDFIFKADTQEAAQCPRASN